MKFVACEMMLHFCQIQNVRLTPKRKLHLPVADICAEDSKFMIFRFEALLVQFVVNNHDLKIERRVCKPRLMKLHESFSRLTNYAEIRVNFNID